MNHIKRRKCGIGSSENYWIIQSGCIGGGYYLAKQKREELKKADNELQNN